MDSIYQLWHLDGMKWLVIIKKNAKGAARYFSGQSTKLLSQEDLSSVWAQTLTSCVTLGQVTSPQLPPKKKKKPHEVLKKKKNTISTYTPKEK